MRKLLIVLGILIAVYVTPIYIPTFAYIQQETPAYTKWGRLALKETHSKYPNANIIDYLHEGSEIMGDSTIEKFKLWLKDGTHEFGVFVRIEFTTETEKVVNIELQETSK